METGKELADSWPESLIDLYGTNGNVGGECDENRQPSWNSRKRPRCGRKIPTVPVAETDFTPCDSEDYITWDEGLMSYIIPKEMEEAFATAVFELGLKHCSPKILMEFMPPKPSLKRVNIKSHLQKLRTQPERSKEQFHMMWLRLLQKDFSTFQYFQRWRHMTPEVHRLLRKQITAARKLEEYKEFLRKFIEVHMEVEEAIAVSSLVEVKVLKDIYAKIVSTQMKCDDYSGIVDMMSQMAAIEEEDLT